MLPTPARNAWSTSSGFSLARRPRIRARNALSVNRSSSGSGPTPSKGSSSATYSPTRPNLRTSRKRTSRQSSSARASRSYGSAGVPASSSSSKRERQQLIRVDRQGCRDDGQLAGHLQADREERPVPEVHD